MKFNLPEILPLENNRYFYTIEKSMYGGYVIYLELESDLKASGTLLDETTKHHWKPLPSPNADSNQLELKFYD
jgi:hypothetical protein